MATSGRPHIAWGEALVRALVAGVGSISLVALLLVAGVLISESLPLWAAAELKQRSAVRGDAPPPEAAYFRLDETGRLGVFVVPDGTARLVEPGTGSKLGEVRLTDAPATAFDLPPYGPLYAAGFADGTAALGRLSFEVSRVPEDLSAEPRDNGLPLLLPGEARPDGNGLLERGSDGVLVRQEAVAVQGPRVPIFVDGPASIRLVHAAEDSRGTAVHLAALAADGRIAVVQLGWQDPWLPRLGSQALPDRVISRTLTPPPIGEEPPRWLFVSPSGREVTLFWSSGRCRRLVRRGDGPPSLLDETDLIADEGAELVRVVPLPGRNAFVLGDSAGRPVCWTYSPGEGGSKWSSVHLARYGEGPIRAVLPFRRGPRCAVAYSDGTLAVHHLGTGAESVAANRGMGPSWRFLALTGGNHRGLLTSLSGAVAARWDYVLPQPDARWGTPDGKTGGDGDSPEKSSPIRSGSGETDLRPLFASSFRIAWWTCLWSCPAAIAAAVCATQFLARPARRGIRMVMEGMVCVPGLILGYAAAFVVGPWAASHGDALGPIAFLLLPTAVGIAALRQHLAGGRSVGAGRAVAIALAAAGGATIAVHCSPACKWGAERVGLLLFGPGTGHLWGPAIGFPGMLLGLAAYCGVWRTRWLALFGTAPIRAAAADLLGLTTVATGIVLLVRGLAAWSDAQSEVVPLGFPFSGLAAAWMLLFAVVPIVYLGAEETLAAVPDELRVASLAVGADTWQTLSQVVLPRAGWGLAACCLIGFSRALGETMVAFVATGNGAIDGWSPFTGARTLPANILDRFPEASAGTPEYHLLVFTALLLFLVTFALNSLAERLRRLPLRRLDD